MCECRERQSRILYITFALYPLANHAETPQVQEPRFRGVGVWPSRCSQGGRKTGICRHHSGWSGGPARCRRCLAHLTVAYGESAESKPWESGQHVKRTEVTVGRPDIPASRPNRPAIRSRGRGIAPSSRLLSSVASVVRLDTQQGRSTGSIWVFEQIGIWANHRWLHSLSTT